MRKAARVSLQRLRSLLVLMRSVARYISVEAVVQVALAGSGFMLMIKDEKNKMIEKGKKPKDDGRDMGQG